MGGYDRCMLDKMSYSMTRNNHGSTGTWLVCRIKKKRGRLSLFFSFCCAVCRLAQQVLNERRLQKPQKLSDIYVCQRV